MEKTLIIAEKPSVARDLVRALQKKPGVEKFADHKEYFENDSMVISSAIGHLVQITMPTTAEGKKIKWGMEPLPILPDKFNLEPIRGSAERLKLLKKLLKRKDITKIINACDAGREGELIFRYLMEVTKVDKPIQRLWLQSMTISSIQEAFDHLRSDEEMHPLADAALCRSESDWLVGINSTRALTAFNSRYGGFQLTPVGRVQTPTLAILQEREEQIRTFVSKDFQEVTAQFSVAAGSYTGKWFVEKFKKDPEDDQKRPERIWSLQEAETIKERCLGKEGEVEEKKKPTSQASALLYDLTSLQRDASSRYGFSAKRTLQIAQALYERYKVLTYPRTDSRYLPEDYIAQVKTTLGNLEHDYLQPHAQKILQQDWVVPNKRIFNNAKVSDHFAIIPTGQQLGKLDEAHLKIFLLVARRFLAIFFPSARFEVTKRITRIGEDTFKTDGRILVEPGWLEVYGKSTEDEKDALAPVEEGEKATAREIEIAHKQTQPPPRYTEATLLSAMEGAGKLIEDEELREAMSERGLGTPATRAAIIEGLIDDKYVARHQRELVATAKARSLMQIIADMKVQALCSPQLTGEWEHKLKLMEQGKLDRSSFMREIRAVTEEIVTKAKKFNDNPVETPLPPLDVPCPRCGAHPLTQGYQRYRCPSCDFNFFKTVASKTLEPEEVAELLTKRELGPLDGFRSKRGFEFSATLKLDEEHKTQFAFADQEDNADRDKPSEDEEYLCNCPQWPEAKVFQNERAYLCRAADTTLKLRVSKTILQRQIPPEQATKLFEKGKTDLLTGFVSKKGRKFSAHLTLEGEKVGFEFANKKKDKKTSSAQKEPTKKSL